MWFNPNTIFVQNVALSMIGRVGTLPPGTTTVVSLGCIGVPAASADSIIVATYPALSHSSLSLLIKCNSIYIHLPLFN